MQFSMGLSDAWAIVFDAHGEAWRQHDGVHGVPPRDYESQRWAVAIDSAYADIDGSDQAQAPQKSDRCQRSQMPFPFEEFLLPLVRFFRAELERRASPSAILNERSLIAIERRLLRDLSHLALLPLHLEFRLFRGEARIDYADPDHSAGPSTLLYCGFIKHCLSEGLNPLFMEYSVLARLLGSITVNAIDAAVELVDRFRSDQEVMKSEFLVKTAIITDIEPHLSDPHCGGRTVAAITIDDCVRVIYKPRRVTNEYGFSEFMTWLGCADGERRLHPLRIVDRGEYGWVESAALSACATQSDDYFFATGMILCAAYTLCGADLHCENIIATEHHAVLIDLEVLVSASRGEPSFDTAANALADHPFDLRDSVLSTGFLPFWQTGSSGARFDMSGIGASGYQSEYPWYAVSSTNTDSMRIDFCRQVIPSSQASTVQPVSKHQRESLRLGFVRAHELVRHRTAELMVPNKSDLGAFRGPLAAFGSSNVRHVCRPTRLYGRLLQRITHPACLRTGLDYARELAVLLDVVRNERDPVQRAHFERIVFAEIQSLEQLDIPRFDHSSNSRDLYSDNRMVAPSYFRRCGVDRVVDRLRGMTDTDRAVQSRLIEASLHSRYATTVTPTAHREDTRTFDGLSSALLTDDAIVDGAMTTARAILEARLHCGNGSTGWIAVSKDEDPTIGRVVGTDFLLYGGQIGIALFLGAAGYAGGDTECWDAGQDCLLQVLERVDQPGNGAQSPRPVGLAGLGGVVLAATILDRIQSTAVSRRLIDKLVQSLLRVDPVNDLRLDVIGGSAGAILAMSSLWAHRPDERILDVARRFAAHLLGARSDAGRFRVWKTLDDQPPMNGFAHGSAGIGLSLAIAGKWCDDDRCCSAFEESLAFEASTLTDDGRAWKDLRYGIQSQPAATMSWCHGAAGIGLARLVASGLSERPTLRPDIDRAIALLGLGELVPFDGMCCGEGGVIDFLLEASAALGRSDLQECARRRLSLLIRRFQIDGEFRLFTGLTPPGLHPGFFQGASGLGYLMLRAVRPDVFPSVLTVGSRTF